MKVAVFGLGYVGLVSAVCLGDLGHDVVGVDVSSVKVAQIAGGHSPITEPGVVERLERLVAAGQLRATTDAADAVAGADVVLICVGTPSDRHGALDCSALVSVSAAIGQALRGANRFPVVAVRSTVLPGVIREQLVPMLESSGLVAGVDFGVCANPEFLREGSAIADFLAPSFTLIGAMDEASGERLRELYARIDAPVYRTGLDESSLVKYASNVYHALKVAFANEMGVVCTRAGIDSHEVMELFCRDTKLNASASYLKPGFAFGGSCLPKDLRALLNYARHADVDVPLLGAVFPSNELHVRRAVDLILSTGERRVGVLGLSFKAHTDDLRESPLVQLIEALLGRGLDVAVFDEEVNLARIFGRNREYIDRVIPHITVVMRDRADAVVRHGGVLVVGKPTAGLGDLLASTVVEGQLVVDLARALKGSVRLDGGRRVLRVA
jgi:GDP-mannose 6-dehydrogenase